MRFIDRISGILLAVLAAASQVAAAPQRVVSMNLCADQLAMMLAAPGQLISVSYLARDPEASAMAVEAQAFPVNHGLAEEIFLLQPDLVIAGQYTTQATVSMLKRLGIPVAIMAPADSLEDARDRMTEMGAHLGHPEKATALVAEFDENLGRLAQDADEGPRAAIYAAHGYTFGPQSLSGDILRAAGLRNVAEEAGLDRGGMLALERLVMLAPDLVILSQRRGGNSRAEEILNHPALRALLEEAGVAPLTDRNWVCGTPHVLRAIAGLAVERDAGQEPK
ncbi:ABC transporter substrate-binding protein [Hoeflea sp. WL0058]|uniref:ABC transporter substrate-binding protein n=1 Tax=Flavimaribacter sediminis TaxID=2865987 RepID=A0AAE3D2I5_9HYPH|nr:ABC transporter substrate-binding protein [Flavimaribacter sediminis]MBW8638633.1 ABC transporter substrate-binding protein [Flavimaribacter sediminis]